MYKVTNSSKSYNNKELEALKVAMVSVVCQNRRRRNRRYHHHHHHHVACSVLGLLTCFNRINSLELF
jgi:hypothetical protein